MFSSCKPYAVKVTRFQTSLWLFFHCVYLLHIVVYIYPFISGWTWVIFFPISTLLRIIFSKHGRQIYIWWIYFSSLEYFSGDTRSHGSSIFVGFFGRGKLILYFTRCNNLCTVQQMARIAFMPHLYLSILLEQDGISSWFWVAFPRWSVTLNILNISADHLYVNLSEMSFYIHVQLPSLNSFALFCY